MTVNVETAARRRIAGAARRGRGRGPREARFLAHASDFLSIEGAFALFLFSGHYKTLPELQGFPVDLTLFFLVVTLCVICGAFLSGRIGQFPLTLPVLSMLLFSQYAVATVFWSSLDSLNIDKEWRFLFLTAPSFFIAHAIAQDPARRERLLRTVTWFSAALLLYYVYHKYVLGNGYSPFDEAKDRLGGNTYLTYGTHASIVFIVCLAAAVFGARRQIAAAIAGTGAALYLLLVIGGRGPLAAAVFAVPLLAFGLVVRSGESLSRVLRLAFLLSSLAAAAAVSYAVIVHVDGSGPELTEFRTINRYEAQISQDDTNSVDERKDGQRFAFHRWLEKPIFGWGIGEFRVKDSYLEYPHNLLLEILMETGVVGGFLFLIAIVGGLVNCVRLARAPAAGWVEVSIALLFLTDLALHVTEQGYLADDRIFFAWIGLAASTSAVRGRASPAPLPSPGAGRKRPR